MQRDKAKPISYNTVKKNCKLFGYMPDEKSDAEEIDEEEIAENSK